MRRRGESAERWADAAYLVIDFETTSLDHRRAQPLSVGWLPVRGGRLILAEAGYTHVRHSEEIPADSIAVHRLVPEDVAGGPTPLDVGRSLAVALERRILVAHGAHHEVAMLRLCGVTWRKRDCIDTIHLARALDRIDGRQAARDYTLAAVARRRGLPVHRSHHAFGDALTTGVLFLALAARLEGRGRSGLDELRRLSVRRRPGLR